MLRREDYLMILIQRRERVLPKDIAEELEVHPKTVSRALNRGSAPSEERRQRGSILDAYRWKVDELVGEIVWNGKVILLELQALGYGGSCTVLNYYLRPLRQARRVLLRDPLCPGLGAN